MQKFSGGPGIRSNIDEDAEGTCGRRRRKGKKMGISQGNPIVSNDRSRHLIKPALIPAVDNGVTARLHLVNVFIMPDECMYIICTYIQRQDNRLAIEHVNIIYNKYLGIDNKK